MAPVVLTAVQTRHPSLNPDKYIDHYDNIHIPLLRSYVGEDFPVSHSRYYTKHESDSSGFSPAVVMGPHALGGQKVDSVAVVVFQDEEHFKRFNAKCAGNGVWDVIQEDMNKLWKDGVVRCVVAGEPSVTQHGGS